jgi:hypothetical protein
MTYASFGFCGLLAAQRESKATRQSLVHAGSSRLPNNATTHLRRRPAATNACSKKPPRLVRGAFRKWATSLNKAPVRERGCTQNDHDGDPVVNRNHPATNHGFATIL